MLFQAHVFVRVSPLVESFIYFFVSYLIFFCQNRRLIALSAFLSSFRWPALSALPPPGGASGCLRFRRSKRPDHHDRGMTVCFTFHVFMFLFTDNVTDPIRKTFFSRHMHERWRRLLLVSSCIFLSPLCLVSSSLFIDEKRRGPL